jgi:two-component system, LytTR family, sensor kinase
MEVDQIEEAGRAPVLRIGWRGVALILVFWTFFGAVMSVSLFLGGLPRSGDATASALVAFTFLGAYTWAALTLPLFHLTQRLNLTGEQGSWRVLRVAGLVVFGAVLSVSVSVAIAFGSRWVFNSLNLLGGRLAGPEGPWAITRYRLTHDLLACHLVLAAGVARDYFLRYRSRLAEATLLRSQLAEARLQVLRTQLNPHFLFNTLNAVAAMVQTDPRGVRRMIALLSDLLRQTLDGASEQEVPLERELEMLGRYLQIMEIRFGGRFDARVEVGPELSRALVPQLLLQPLVENAMQHGIGRASGKGSVVVSAARVDGELVLRVRDSGPGSREAGREEGREEARAGEPAAAPGNGDPHWGLGLRHTRERLRQLYDDAGRLVLIRTVDGGTTAEVRLPFHAASPAAPGSLASPDSQAAPATEAADRHERIAMARTAGT